MGQLWLLPFKNKGRKKIHDPWLFSLLVGMVSKPGTQEMTHKETHVYSSVLLLTEII